MPIGGQTQVGPLKFVQRAEVVQERERGTDRNQAGRIDKRVQFVDVQVVVQPQIAVADEEIQPRALVAEPSLPQQQVGPLKVGRRADPDVARLHARIGDQARVLGQRGDVDERPGEYGVRLLLAVNVCVSSPRTRYCASSPKLWSHASQ